MGVLTIGRAAGQCFRRAGLSPALVLLVLVAGSAGPVAASAPPPSGAIWLRGGNVWAERGVASWRVATVKSVLDLLPGTIGRDFGVYPGPLQVRLYATHRSFTAALWRLQRQRPQSPYDDSGSVSAGTLLLGPLPAAYLRHNLAHNYAEWLEDRLSGNLSDVLPPGTWFYDGIAEYEAFRRVPTSLACSGTSVPAFDITRVNTPDQWLHLRAGPLGPLEYCLAYQQVRRLVRRLGWSCMVRLLHRPDIWRRVAAHPHSFWRPDCGARR